MNKLDILKSYSFYERLSAPERDALLQAAMLVELDPDQFFFREGDQCGHLALIGSGELRIFKATESGREITLYHVERGDACVISASCAMSDGHYPASAKAQTKVVAVTFPSILLRRWIANNDAIRTWVFDTMANRLERVMSLVTEVSFFRLDRRIASFLLERFEGEPRHGSTLKITHEELATEMGTAREVVSRILRELRREGAIELSRGCIELLDRAILESISERD